LETTDGEELLCAAQRSSQMCETNGADVAGTHGTHRAQGGRGLLDCHAARGHLKPLLEEG